MSGLRRIAGALGIVALAPFAASANQASDAARYERCLKQVALNPGAAVETALEWAGEGGGAPAKHCHALALIAAGHPENGALHLEQLAKARGAFGDDLRAEMLIQAGNAWLIAEVPDAAANDFTAAIELARLAKLSAEIQAAALADRARAHLLLKKKTEARADLNASISLSPSPSALTLRARLAREAGDRAGAQADLSRALGIDAQFPDALLERGRLRLASGDKKGARQDFINASFYAKTGPVSDAAQLELGKLDLRQ